MSEPVYSTMASKVAAYEDFFNSEETQTLVVIGPGGSGKSAALNRVEKHSELVLHIDDYPHIRAEKGLDDDISGSEPITMSRTIYHLFDTDEDLAQALKRKYGARIVRFERGTEDLDSSPKEYVDFMEAIEFFYVAFRDCKEQKNNSRLEVGEIRKAIQILQKELEETPRL